VSKPNVREQLLAAGLETLHARGFNATGVQDIVDAAGVPKGSFYNHFASKDALGAEVVQAYAAKAGTRLRLLQDSSVPPLVRLHKYFEALNQLGVASGYAHGCLLGNFSTELSAQSPAIRDCLRAVFTDWTAAIAVVIAEAQGAGDVPKTMAASTLAGFLVDAWEGAVMRSKVERSGGPLDAFLAVAFSKILA
jgi:TetR/AcrR family transcriptional regulator, transcriptional repressor for nem operon